MTQAERAHETLHQACHDSGDNLEFHNIETITIDDEPAHLLYLFCESELHSFSGLTFQDMPYRIGVATLCLPQELQLRYCLVDFLDRFFRVADEPNHQLPYKGTTVGQVLDLVAKMGMKIPMSIIRRWKATPLV